jgi:hypothetical protein
MQGAALNNSGASSLRGVEIAGDDIFVVADCVREYVHWVTEHEASLLTRPRPWILPDGIRMCRRIPFTAFLQMYRIYTV